MEEFPAGMTRTAPALALARTTFAIFLFLARTVRTLPAGALLAAQYPTPGQIVIISVE